MGFLLAALLAAAAPADESALSAALGAQAMELVPGSMRRLDSPSHAGWTFYTWRDTSTGRVRGAAVKGAEVAFSDDGSSLARFVSDSGLVERGAARELLEAWAALAQAGRVVGSSDEVAPEDRAAVTPPFMVQEKQVVRAVGFLRQGEQVDRVELVVEKGSARAEIEELGRWLGRDDVDGALAALRSRDEVVRAAAASELGSGPAARVTVGLLKALGDASAVVRGTAADSLGRVCSREPGSRAALVRPLRDAAGHEQDASAKRAMESAARAASAR